MTIELSPEELELLRYILDCEMDNLEDYTEEGKNLVEVLVNKVWTL